MIKCMLVSCIAVFSLWADQPNQEIFEHLQRRGHAEFEKITKKYGCFTGGDWKDTINRVFTRVMRASGRADNLALCVIKAPGFNAGALPSGQFIIHEDALNIFGALAKQVAKSDLLKEAAIREVLLAGITGHELAHYYNQHAFKTYQKIHSAKGKVADVDQFLTNIAYNRELEFEADRAGHMLLQAAGYDADQAMVLAFEVMKLVSDKMKEQVGDNGHYYLQTHPSTRERLARFESQNKDWYRETAEVEKAFADANSGVNLARAIAIISKAVEKYPENLILQQTLAVARHKSWLETVPLKEQKLRAILDVPSYSDQLLESKRGSKGAKDIPGDKAKFFAAKKQYTKLMASAVPDSVKSNYAALLAYSDDEKDQKDSVSLAQAAQQSANNAQTINNLALALFVTGKEQEALKILGQVSPQVEKSFREMKSDKAAAIGRFIAYSQLVDKGYVFPDMTIVLNYALALGETGKSAESVSIALQYLELYDNNSSWARRLAKATKNEAKLAKSVERKYVEVNGIKIGSSVGDLVAKWKEGKNIATGSDAEVWTYPGLEARVFVDGMIKRIDLAGEKSPKLPNGLGVGSTRVALEKLLGEPSSLRDGYYVYSGAQPAAVLYQSGKAVQVILLRE